jgi:hypothetical protein
MSPVSKSPLASLSIPVGNIVTVEIPSVVAAGTAYHDVTVARGVVAMVLIYSQVSTRYFRMQRQESTAVTVFVLTTFVTMIVSSARRYRLTGACLNTMVSWITLRVPDKLHWKHKRRN